MNDVVMFLPGSTRECFDLNIIDDILLEMTETFLVSLDSSDVNVVIVSPSQAVVSIIDNDQR